MPGIDSTGTPCSLKDLQAVQDAKKAAKAAWNKFLNTVASIIKAIQDIRWGRIGDQLAAIAIAQAGAIAQVAAAAATGAIGSLAAAAFEQLFKYILYLVSLGPTFIMSVMKKPLDRALFYAQKELVYLNQAKANFGRIMSIMNSMFDLELLPDYSEKMRASFKKIQECMRSFSALIQELDSSKYFRKARYNQAMSNLHAAIDLIRTNTPISQAFSARLEARRADKTALNKTKRDQRIAKNEAGRNVKITNAAKTYSYTLNNIIGFYTPIIFQYYQNLLKQKNLPVNNDGAQQYINSLASMDKDGRGAEVTTFMVTSAVSAVASSTVSIVQPKESQQAGQDQKSFANSISSGYATGGSSPSGTLGLKFSKDLRGCVNAINDAENTKIADVTSANQVLEEKNKSANLNLEADNAGDTITSIGEAFSSDLGDAFTDAYSDRWSTNLKMLEDEFHALANNGLTAFTFYKKRQACTKGCAFAVNQLRKAFEICNKYIVSNMSGAAGMAISASMTAILNKLIYDTTGASSAGGNIMERDIAMRDPSKTRLAVDSNTVYGKLLTGETALQSYITPSLIDIINAQRAFDDADALVIDIIRQISTIPDWDGGTRMLDPDAKSADATAAWIFTDLKKNSPNSPYVSIITDITSLSLTAPIKILQGGTDKIDVQKKIVVINGKFNKLIQHNAYSTQILSKLEVPYNPYAEVAMAQLDKYGMDMLMDLFEAASFSVMAKNIIVGQVDYLRAQLKCAQKLNESETTPAARATAAAAAADARAKDESNKAADMTNRANQDALVIEEVLSPNPGVGKDYLDYLLSADSSKVPEVENLI